jgi:hypothetical protein
MIYNIQLATVTVHFDHISGGLWGARRVGTYGDRINWRKIEDDILQISEHMYTQERFQRDTHDVDQKALKVVLYPRVCSLRQYEVQLPKRELHILQTPLAFYYAVEPAGLAVSVALYFIWYFLFILYLSEKSFCLHCHRYPSSIWKLLLS